MRTFGTKNEVKKTRYLGDILCQTIHQFDWPREFWDQNPRKKLENYLKWLNQFAPSMNVYPHAKNQHHTSKVLLRVTTHFYFLSTPLLPSPPFFEIFSTPLLKNKPLSSINFLVTSLSKPNVLTTLSSSHST